VQKYIPESNFRFSAGFSFLFSARQVFNDRERSNLLSDALSLARTGQLSYLTALDVTSYLSRADETSLLPWDTVTRAFHYIRAQLYNEQHFTLWQVSRVVARNRLELYRVATNITVPTTELSLNLSMRIDFFVKFVCKRITKILSVTVLNILRFT